MTPSSIFPGPADFGVLQFEAWVLVLVRTSMVVFLLPVIGNQEVPLAVKAGLSVLVSVVLYATLPEGGIELPGTPGEFLLLALRELYVGVVMGFAASFVFIGIRLAGTWMDQETGFAMVQLLNPLADEQNSAMGSLLLILFGLLFLAWDGHHFFLRALAESFRVIPLAAAELQPRGVAGTFAHMTAEAFVFGIKAAAPIIATIFITTVGLAIVARIMPQMNVWLVGMPLKIGLGLLTLSFCLPIVWHIFVRQQETIQAYCMALVRLLGS